MVRGLLALDYQHRVLGVDQALHLLQGGPHLLHTTQITAAAAAAETTKVLSPNMVGGGTVFWV